MVPSHGTANICGLVSRRYLGQLISIASYSPTSTPSPGRTVPLRRAICKCASAPDTLRTRWDQVPHSSRDDSLASAAAEQRRAGGLSVCSTRGAGFYIASELQG